MKKENLPESLLKIKADSSQKRYTFAVIIGTILFIVISYLIGAFAVPAISRAVIPDPVCPPQMTNYNAFCGFLSFQNGEYWQSYMTNLNKTNVFVQLTGKFHVNPNQNNTSGFSFGVHFTSTISALKTINDSSLVNPANLILVANSNDTITVNCPAGAEYCDINNMLLYPQLQYQNYLLQVQLQLDATVSGLVDGILFGAKVQNPPFTIFLVVFRYICFGISVLSFLVYALFYCQSEKRYLTFEHKAILLLSFSLVFFNDPIFGVTLFDPSIVSAVFSTIFVMQFVAILIAFWITMWKRMATEGAARQTRKCGWLAIILGIIIFSMLTISGSLASVYSRFDPGVQANTE